MHKKGGNYEKHNQCREYPAERGSYRLERCHGKVREAPGGQRLHYTDYIDLTIRCVEENGPYIVITPGLALSHSRPDASVHKTGLSLLTLKEPISFGSENDPVDIVLTLAATDDTSHLEMLQGMAEYISEEENLEAIRTARDSETAAKAINEFEADL